MVFKKKKEVLGICLPKYVQDLFRKNGKTVMIDITEDQNSLCAAEVGTTEDLERQKDMFMDWKNVFSLFK